MKDVYGLRKRRNAQTLVFFLLAWGTIMLLCGLAIDSGLLYLAKARMGRAVDGAALAAIGNFNRNTSSPQANRDAIATIMRNFAVANFTDLSPIAATVAASGAPSGGTAITTIGVNGQPATSYTYSFNDGTQDPNGAYKRFVDVTLNTGSGGAITGATCNARCPVQTYFIGYGYALLNGQPTYTGSKIGGYHGPSGLVDLKVSSSAVATRNPRLIMVVIDRSASMLLQGGGAVGLPPAIVQFLDFFDTSSDTIGIVSFGSSARLEMPMTTNFIIAGTNNLIDAYETNIDNGRSVNDPGVDPETVSTNGAYQPDYNAGGVRRLKFGGQTAADDGIRLGLETMMANAGFSDPDVVKYMVLFTDGAWNASRTLVAAPGYINEVQAPALDPVHHYVQYVAQNNNVWDTDITNDANLIPVPSMGLVASRSSLPFSTNAMNYPENDADTDFANLVNDHTNDTWQSTDVPNGADILEPLNGSSQSSSMVGNTMGVTNTTWVGVSSDGKTNYYTQNVDVWLQPGSVAYYYNTNNLPVNSPTETFVSDYTNPTKHINLAMAPSGHVDLIVPGYIADGVLYDGLDLCYSTTTVSEGTYPRYRADNYQQPYMWPDDNNSTAADRFDNPYYSTSLERQLMFRNYPNLLTGYYVFRADEPNAVYDPSAPVGQQGIEPLITDQTNSAGAIGAARPRYASGAYYPSAGFYWPFGGGSGTNSFGDVVNAVGVDYDPTYGLTDPDYDPDPSYSYNPNGGSRHIAYSINMLSPDAAPEWYGELFYKGTGGTNSVSTTSAKSTIMQSADWKVGAPDFVQAYDITGLMKDEATHNTTITGSPSVWRPESFNGTNFQCQHGLSDVKPGVTGNVTGGYVTDGNGNYFYNTMAYSGRPTHYFDFSLGSWEPITNNHIKNSHFLQIGNWKAQEYAWHARALGVTIYTVGYGQYVDPSECNLLATIANSTNSVYPETAGSSVIETNLDFPYNESQPIGQQFYATTGDQISNDFYSVGQAINAALTQ